MVSSRLFQACPPFPDNVPLAQLSTISLAGLASKSKTERKAMFQACQNSGFFLLDLKGDKLGEEMIRELDQIFGVIEQTMHVSEEEISKYHQVRPTRISGFKREGHMKTETGQQDRCTFYAVQQDDLLGHIPEIDAPESVRVARSLLKSYIEHGQDALALILAGLEVSLDLPRNTLRDLQSPKVRSGTVLRMIRSAPSHGIDEMRTSLLPHTDYGSVTLLANILGGLQVLRPGADAKSREPNDWLWVKPQPGCLIVNMGDAMVEWTGGVLRSNVHRVNYAPGEQRLVERFALAMLVRARHDAKMERIPAGLIPRLEDDQLAGIDFDGVGVKGLTASEWEVKKADMLTAGRDIAQSQGGRPLRIAAAS